MKVTDVEKISVSLPADVLALLDGFRGAEPRSTALAAIVRAYCYGSTRHPERKKHVVCAWCGRAAP